MFFIIYSSLCTYSHVKGHCHYVCFAKQLPLTFRFYDNSQSNFSTLSDACNPKGKYDKSKLSFSTKLLSLLLSPVTFPHTYFLLIHFLIALFLFYSYKSTFIYMLYIKQKQSPLKCTCFIIHNSVDIGYQLTSSQSFSFSLSIFFSLFLYLVLASRFIRKKLCPSTIHAFHSLCLSLFPYSFLCLTVVVCVYALYLCTFLPFIHPSIHPSNVLCYVSYKCMHDLVKSSPFPIAGWRVHPSSLMASSTIHSGIHNTNTHKAAAIHTQNSCHDSLSLSLCTALPKANSFFSIRFFARSMQNEQRWGNPFHLISYSISSHLKSYIFIQFFSLEKKRISKMFYYKVYLEE